MSLLIKYINRLIYYIHYSTFYQLYVSLLMPSVYVVYCGRFYATIFLNKITLFYCNKWNRTTRFCINS